MIDTLNRALIAAAWDNDVAEAGRLIAESADVNAKDDTVQSAYLIATSEGYVELLNLTLGHGADIASKDSYNGTGLIRAADRGHAEVIAVLLLAGIEVDHINNLGWTALHEAIILGNGDQRYVDCVRLLLAAGADPTLASQRDGIRPEQHAQSRGFDTIATTIRRVIDSQPSTEPASVLLGAARAGDPDGMVMAIRSGGLEIVTGSGIESVHATAMEAGSEDCLRLLTLLTKS